MGVALSVHVDLLQLAAWIESEAERLARAGAREPKIRITMDMPDAVALAQKLRRMALLEDRL